MQSIYLERFKRLKESGALFHLHGNRLIVEVLPKEELKKGSLIIASDMKNLKSSTEENRAQLAVVLAVGNGYFDEATGKVEALPYEQGEVILVSPFGLKYYSQFPGIVDFTDQKIALTRESEIHMSWNDFKAFEKYKAALNG
jgi:co-chaperonin GroES (HSP10)